MTATMTRPSIRRSSAPINRPAPRPEPKHATTRPAGQVRNPVELGHKGRSWNGR